MAASEFKWTPRRIKQAREASRVFNRAVNRIRKLNEQYDLYDVVPENISPEYIMNHSGSQADLNAWTRRAENMTLKANKKSFERIQTPTGNVSVPKVVKDYLGRRIMATEYESAKKEQKRQDRKARELQREYNALPSAGEQFQEWGSKVYDASSVFANNINVVSHFEKYVDMISHYDDQMVLSETVEIVQWMMDNAPSALKRIYESGSEIPEIEYVYQRLKNYQDARRRVRKGTKGRKTTTGLTSETNALNKLHAINTWWRMKFNEQTGQEW